MQTTSTTKLLDDLHRGACFRRVTVLLSIVLALLAATTPGSAATSRWLTRFDDAMERAGDDDRYVLVDLYAEWCGWCKVLDEQVFKSPEFGAYAKDFVLLRVDTEDGGEGTELQTRYSVAGLPTTLILDSRGVRIGQVTGIAAPEQYIESLEGEIKTYRNLVKAYDKVVASDQVELQRKLAEEFQSRLDGTRAAGLFERMLDETAGDAGEAAWLRYYVADGYRLGGDFEKARQYLEQAREQAQSLDDQRLIERLDLLSYYVARNSGDCKTAQLRLERYIEAHPESASAPDARRFLYELKTGRARDCA